MIEPLTVEAILAGLRLAAAWRRICSCPSSVLSKSTAPRWLSRRKTFSCGSWRGSALALFCFSWLLQSTTTSFPNTFRGSIYLRSARCFTRWSWATGFRDPRAGSRLGPVAFQPSELIKMVVVVALARYLSELRSSRYMTFAQIAKACLICLVPMGLVALQPDLGTSLTYLPAIAVGLFVRGVRPAALISLVLVFVLAPSGVLVRSEALPEGTHSDLSRSGDEIRLGKGIRSLSRRLRLVPEACWEKASFMDRRTSWVSCRRATRISSSRSSVKRWVSSV